MDAVTDDRRAMSPAEVFEAVKDDVPAMAERLLRNKPRRTQGYRDDLVQVGLTELWKVANRPDGYDPAVASPRTFAGRRVLGAMVDWLRDQRGMHGGRYRQVAAAAARGRAVPTVVELSRIAFRETDEAAGKGSDGYHWPALPPADHADDDAAEVAALIRQTGAVLAGAERSVLIEYVTTGRTLKEIGRRRGLSETRMSQVVSAAAGRVREAMAAKGMRGFHG